MHEIRVVRTHAGWLVFELRESLHQPHDSSGGEEKALREIARRMAAGSDSESLLAELCDSVRGLGGAEGAASWSPRQATKRLASAEVSPWRTRWQQTRFEVVR